MHHSLSARAKFTVPRIPNATVVRHALLAQLDAGRDCSLTLVVAAPGSGKSALLTQWATTLGDRLAWLSCDVDDADPRWFWRDVKTTIRQSWGDAPIDTDDALDGRDPRHLAIEIANDLTAIEHDGVIVIDDFHLAAPGPAAMVAFINALPPSMRVVLGTRTDPLFPLSRMRVQGHLRELRQADLKFTTDEIEQLFASLEVGVSTVDLDRLADLTEGWAVSIHLAGLSLRSVPDPDTVLRRLVETDHSLVDFLMNEVIELQPTDVQDFLFVTGQMDSFDAELCSAVTGRSDSTELLARVHEANLFLTGLDRDGTWYRYHHLFAEFLRARLRITAPERIPVIHRLAADSFTARGELLNAARHHMVAGDTDIALQRLAGHILTTTSLSDQQLGGVVAQAWLREHGTAHLVDEAHAILECVLVLDATQSNNIAAQWLRRVADVEEQLDHATKFMLHGVWAFHLLSEGDPAGALERARHAGEIAEQHLVTSIWAPSLPPVLLQAQLWLDDLGGATATLDRIRADVDGPALIAGVRVPGFEAHIAVVNGDLRSAERCATQSEVGADRFRLPTQAFARAEPALAFAAIAIENNQLDVAEAHVDRLMFIVDRGRRPLLEIMGHLMRAHMACARGDDGGLAEHLKKARGATPKATRVVAAYIDRAELRLALRRGTGNLDSLLDRLPPSVQRDLLAVRVALASGERRRAAELLARLAVPDRPRLRIEHGLLVALAAPRDDIGAVHHRLHETLTVANTFGLLQTIVDEGPEMWKLLESFPAHGDLATYVGRLLSSAAGVVPHARVADQQHMVEPLSDRELTVLRYLASRLDGTEIADSLYLSINTVRSHIKSIYRKLGVKTRADAVRTGESLGLI